MADAEEITIEVEHSKGNEDGSPGSGSGPVAGGYDKLPEGAVKWLMLALKQNNDDIDIPAHSEDSERDLTDAEIEGFDLPEGTNFSVESIFGIDIEREYVGDVSVNDDGETITDVEGNDAVDRHAKIALGKSINGHYRNLVDEQYGDGSHVSVNVGAKSQHDDPWERATYIRFKKTSGGDNSERHKRRAMVECEGVDFSREDYEDWCIENNIDPYPQAQEPTIERVLKSVREKHGDEAFEDFN